MKKWFQKMTIQQYQREKVSPEDAAVCKAMEQCFASITNCNDVKVQFNMDTNEIDVIYTNKNHERVRYSVSQLSDGYRCTISLIADIAYRMAILNPQLLDKVLEETTGIVLIDEIDLHLHLHPVWQQRIIRDLMEIFPKVQFIVSTHAPAVINSVQSESLIVLKENQAYGAPDETYGKDANTILREVMEVAERPQEVKTLFTDFYYMIDGQNYDKAGEIFSTDPVVNEDLDKRLNLNCQAISLPQTRKAAFNALLKDLKKQHATGDIKVYCKRRLEELKQLQENKVPYVGILIDWLEKHT